MLLFSATKLRCVSKNLLSQQKALVMTQHSLLTVCRQLPPRSRRAAGPAALPPKAAGGSWRQTAIFCWVNIRHFDSSASFCWHNVFLPNQLISLTCQIFADTAYFCWVITTYLCWLIKCCWHSVLSWISYLFLPHPSLTRRHLLTVTHITSHTCRHLHTSPIRRHPHAVTHTPCLGMLTI